MAVDAMEIDQNPVPAVVSSPEKERKRKHKNKDESSSAPSKKKRKHETTQLVDRTVDKEKKKKSKQPKTKGKTKQAESGETAIPDTPYVLATATLYLPLSPISISPTHAKASLLAEHLSPLLLTYYPPLQGIVLAYSDASISSTPPPSSSDPADPNPKPLTLAKTAGEYGVLYVYLTATFLVFRPQRGQILEGWVNVQSEGFLGAVVLNLFSVGIERKRLPSDWKWVPPGEEGSVNGDKQKNAASVTASEDESEPSASFDSEKEHFSPVSLANPISDTLTEEANVEDDDSAAEGYFQSVSGHRVRGTVRFRVVDVDVIPGSERDRSFLSIEGTMLTPEEEAKVLEDERNGILTTATTPRRGPSQEPRASMSGALAATATATEPEPEPETPSKTKEVKEEKEKKSKSSKSKKVKKDK
ncbi:hypothetical protein BDV25DRAFT_46369 [Aspergillus avenaceus]|uniref:DNA-directed RNA polymerase subunit n=1 Tax=Aspergillus avenaceus TaxID=36643 RepID=A0A5N6TK71_ASPAV|nr:hypothetical protein BDV25DRAFT_46369 [Aspergillus avenaceus]